MGLAASAAMIRANSSWRVGEAAGGAVEDLGALPARATGRRRWAAERVGHRPIDVLGGAGRHGRDHRPAVGRTHLERGRAGEALTGQGQGTGVGHEGGRYWRAMANRFAFLDHDGPIAFAHRGGAQRRAGEHDAGVRRRRCPRLPLPRDRRPRRPATACWSPSTTRPRPGDGPHGRDRASYRGRRSASPGSTGASPIPRLDDLLGPFPDRPHQHRLQEPTPPSSRWPPCCRRREARRPGAASAAFTDQRLRSGAAPARRRAVHAKGRSASPCSARRLAAAAGVADAARRRAVQVPVEAGPDHGHRPPLRRGAPTRRGCRCTSGRSTTPAEMDRLLDLGVDGIMTDRPACCSEVLVRRGQWREPDRVEVPLTPLDFLARARRLFPDRAGVVQWHGDERATWTYGAVRRARPSPRPPAGRRARRRGPATAWRGCAATRHELLEAYYGVLLAGAVLLPLNIRLAPAEHRLRARRRRRRRRCSATPTLRRPAAGGARPSSLGDELRGARSPRSRPRRSRCPPSTSTRRPSSSTRAGSTGAPEGRAAHPPRAYLHAIHAALTLGHQRPRRRAPHDPAVPRQRLGHAALPDRPRRRARHAAPLRRRRGAAAHRGRARHPAVPGARRWSRRCSTHPSLDRRDLSVAERRSRSAARRAAPVAASPRSSAASAASASAATA